MTFARDFLPWLALSLLALAAPSPPVKSALPAKAAGAAELPDLLLVTIDTLRPDALGFVSGANATPHIDDLARGGWSFTHAVAPAPLTAPAHASLMTGLVPRRHGVRDNGQLLGTAPRTLAEALAARGYATAAFVSAYPLAAMFGLDRGFSTYDDRFPAGQSYEVERSGAATTAAALAWLRGARRPFFLWVHLYEPHYPYTPPSEFQRPGWRGSYDGEVAAADAAFGTLRAGAQRFSSNLWTILAGDHAESLGEHGEGTHGFFVYDSTVLVPLILHAPGRVAPVASNAPARLIDVAPTLLDLLDLPPLVGIDGASLAGLLGSPGARATAAGAESAAYLETQQPWTSYGWAPLAAIRAGDWKLIAAPRAELYNLARDPREQRNLIDTERPRARALRELLRAAEVAPAARATAAQDPEAWAKLRSLGYLGSPSAAEPPTSGLRDPKDGHALRALLTEADALLRRGQPQARRQAIGKFEEVLAADPNNRFALQHAASAALGNGDTAAATAFLKRTIALDSANADAHQLLAETLGRSGDHGAAAAAWMEVVRLQPRRAAAWAALGSELGQSGKPVEAAATLAKAVALEPTDPSLLIRLGFAEFGAGQLAAAAEHLARAAGIVGPDFAHNGALGILLADLERPLEAKSWLLRAGRREPEFAESRYRLALLEAIAGQREQARRHLADAITASASWRARAEREPALRPLLP